MNAAPNKTKREVTSLELPTKTKAALRRIKRRNGISFTSAISQGIVLLEQSFSK